MAGPTLLQAAGAGQRKQTKYAPIFTNRFFTGLWTQRNPLRDPSDHISEKFYGGRPDALIDGLNVELSNNLTLPRRPGLSIFSTASITGVVDFFYSFQKINGTIDVIVDTSSTIYNVTTSSAAAIFTKAAGASQTSFQGVGETLYFGDGVEQQKWNDFGAGVVGNNNGNVTNPTWNWGIVAPATKLGLLITETGNASVTWQANTVFSTMGFLVDSNGNVQQLFAVNASGPNTTPFGTSSSGAPAWNQTPSGTTTESSGTPITWTNFGPIGLWQPSQTYVSSSLGGSLATPCAIYDPVSNSVFLQFNPGNASGVSGLTKPHFTNSPGSFFHDNTIKWGCVGSNFTLWKPSTSFPIWGSSNPALDAGRAIVEPVTLPPKNNQTVWLQISGGGTSGTGGTAPPWASVAGQQTADGDLIYVCQGTATWAANTPYTAWGGQGQLIFSVIKDSNSNMQVAVPNSNGTTIGTSGGSAPTWGTQYGTQTVDNTVTWVCVGTAMSWAASTIWYLPKIGFSPPQPSSPFGGASIIDTNNNVEFVIASGKSGSSAPAWNPVGSNTTDSGITWFATAAFSANSLAFTKGYGYVYAYKSRSATDTYVLNAPPGQTLPLGPPTGSGSGHVSTASPANTFSGPNAGAVITVSGIGSTDPQVDTIEIYRSVDGSQGGPYFLLTDIQNPAPIGGVAQPWSFSDTQPDSNLNELIEAPLANSNNPPPAGLTNLTYHFGRIWGSVGGTVFSSGGPDTLTGSGNEAFPPTNSFQFPSTVNRLVPLTSGLLVFTTSDLYIIAGGPQTSTFYDQILVPNLGLLSYNALAVEGGLVYMFTSDSQFISLDPSAGVSEIGFAIGNSPSGMPNVPFLNFNPANVYVTAHIAGSKDKALFISDGSTGWFRCNPVQAPDGGAVWSPRAIISGGCKAVMSTETSPGVHNLLVGSTNSPSFIGKRDSTTNRDILQTYPAFFVMGSLILAQPGQLAELSFITCDFVATGAQPTISFLLDELTGTFSPFSVFTNDPPQLTPSVSLFANRYYFNQTQAPAWCRHMQVRVDYPLENVQNELLTLTVFGAHWQEE